MWRAVVSQPFDRTCSIKPKGKIDEAAGEFWVENTFMMPQAGHNLSAFEANRLFINLNGKRFLDASFASPSAIDSDSRSAIVADFDGDGDDDLLVGSVGGGPLRMFKNQFPKEAAGNRLQVILTGKTSNRTAIGSRIIAELNDGRRIVRDVFTPNGFRGQAPLPTLIGLGTAETVKKLTVRWPSGKTQAASDIKANYAVTFEEGLNPPDSYPLIPVEE